ncbi:MAG: Fic family protein [Myxococcota bacterium]
MAPALRSLANVDLTKIETNAVLRVVAQASRALGELKGLAASIPNDAILINALALQEAKDSSAIENIVTTHDELFKAHAVVDTASLSAKEVDRYAQALRLGYTHLGERKVLATSTIVQIQAALEPAKAGFRKVPGTALRDSAGRVVYTPPDPSAIAALMGDFEKFIHQSTNARLDPLIRMAVAHHQFESIHPFYDGNGRTGRILNVLMLVLDNLLNTPILYLSREILRSKSDYYRLLQDVRDSNDSPNAWEAWLIYLVDAVRTTAEQGISTVSAIAVALQDVKHRVRASLPRIYSQDLLNNIFTNPYTKIEFVERDLRVTRLTATKYLNALAQHGFVTRKKAGRSNYYVNDALVRILSNVGAPP